MRIVLSKKSTIVPSSGSSTVVPMQTYYTRHPDSGGFLVPKIEETRQG